MRASETREQGMRRAGKVTAGLMAASVAGSLAVAAVARAESTSSTKTSTQDTPSTTDGSSGSGSGSGSSGSGSGSASSDWGSQSGPSVPSLSGSDGDPHATSGGS